VLTGAGLCVTLKKHGTVHKSWAVWHRRGAAPLWSGIKTGGSFHPLSPPPTQAVQFNMIYLPRGVFMVFTSFQRGG